MVGYSAEYVDGEIHLQKEELSRGKWFSKDNLPILPEKLSIARKLIDAWLENRIYSSRLSRPRLESIGRILKLRNTEEMKEKLWNANYIKVMTTNFLLYFAFYLLTPLLPLYLSETFGATKDVIGIVLSGYTVAALIIRPFSGYVVDGFSRKKVLMVCLTAFAIFFAGYIAASTILMFAICRTLHGGPFGAVTVANSTCAIDVLPASRRNEGIGLYGLSNNFAMAIAPSIGIYLHNLVGSYMVLVLDSLSW